MATWLQEESLLFCFGTCWEWIKTCLCAQQLVKSTTGWRFRVAAPCCEDWWQSGFPVSSCSLITFAVLFTKIQPGRRTLSELGCGIFGTLVSGIWWLMHGTNRTTYALGMLCSVQEWVQPRESKRYWWILILNLYLRVYMEFKCPPYLIDTDLLWFSYQQTLFCIFRLRKRDSINLNRSCTSKHY